MRWKNEKEPGATQRYAIPSSGEKNKVTVRSAQNDGKAAYEKRNNAIEQPRSAAFAHDPIPTSPWIREYGVRSVLLPERFNDRGTF